jgi:hypothetical protein
MAFRFIKEYHKAGLGPELIMYFYAIQAGRTNNGQLTAGRYFR